MSTCAVFAVRFGEEESISHHGIFVQTDEDGCGTLFDARGAVAADGALIFKRSAERLSRFGDTIAKGVIEKDGIEELGSICSGVAAPDSQYLETPEVENTMPTCRCGEWVARVWSALRASGIVKAT
ncbi:hypothetical protein QQS21_008847 [Conoideocrella luteorostrata]|uniref:Uncharacterized protein n=1 Tax=Conoideocrella luteorostrata TaxID=1105319 RepID=A0AAJ0FVM1_9HYPO|nr:hypothetical protein QQS21_008847 [Conoideocrella luteorostrata]